MNSRDFFEKMMMHEAERKHQSGDSSCPKKKKGTVSFTSKALMSVF
jgi:hypothetical protein